MYCNRHLYWWRMIRYSHVTMSYLMYKLCYIEITWTNKQRNKQKKNGVINFKEDKKKIEIKKKKINFILWGKWTRTRTQTQFWTLETELNECFIGPKIAIIYIQHLNYYDYRNETENKNNKNKCIKKIQKQPRIQKCGG